MKIHLTKLFALLSILSMLSCDPKSYITQKHYFKNEYILSQVEAPKYHFSKKNKANPIHISFPKQEEFYLQLSSNSCGGQYEATIDGDIEFTRTNCSSDCCETEWDEYIITLIKKVTSYEGGDKNTLILYIDNNNYLLLDRIEKPIISTP